MGNMYAKVIPPVTTISDRSTVVCIEIQDVCSNGKDMEESRTFSSTLYVTPMLKVSSYLTAGSKNILILRTVYLCNISFFHK